MGARLWTLAVFCCATLAGAAACEKDRPPQPESLDTANASRPITRRERPSAIPIGAWSADAEAMVAVDAAQFRDSPLGAFANNLLRTMISSPAGCGDALIDNARHILVVSMGEHTAKPIYVFHGVSRKDVAACTDAPSVWLGDDTLALAPTWDQAALRAATAGKDRPTNPHLLEAISHVDTGAAMWFAAAPAADSNNWNEAFTEMRGTVALDGGLRVSFEMKYPNHDAAASAAEQLEHSIDTMAPFNQYFEDTRTNADGPWLQARIVMSRNQLARLAKEPMFSAFAPTDDPPID